MICLICTSNYSIILVVCYTGPQYCDLYKKQLHGIGGGGHGAQGSQQSQSLVGQLGLCVSGVQLYSVHLCGIGVHSLVSATARSCSSVPGNYHTFACQGSFNGMCFMVRNCIVCSDTQRVQLYATAVLLIRRALQIVFYQCALHCCYVVHVVHICPLAIHTSSW